MFFHFPSSVTIITTTLLMMSTTTVNIVAANHQNHNTSSIIIHSHHDPGSHDIQNDDYLVRQQYLRSRQKLKSSLRHRHERSRRALQGITTSSLSSFSDDSTASTLLYPHDQCTQTIDLCEDGSTCSGLKQIFIKLCFKEDEEMTACTSDCAFLLTELKREATKQGKVIDCVEYLQQLPSECGTQEESVNYESPPVEDFELFPSCPSESAYTSYLRPGEYESISCKDLYPSGIFGNGIAYRYCMVGGDGAIVTETACQYDPLNRPNSTISSKALIPNADGSRRAQSTRNNKSQKILDGAQGASSTLTDAAELLEPLADSKGVLKKIGDIATKLGPALQVVGIAFNIANIILGNDSEEESAELKYMKEQFGIVNQKLDELEEQLDKVAERLSLDIIKSQFEVYKATLGTCGIRLKSYQLSPTENSGMSFRHGCCLADRSPLNYLQWMANNAEDFVGKTLTSLEYQMDSFLNEMQAVIHSTTIASFYHSTCSGFDGLNEEGLKYQVQEGVDRAQSVIKKVQSEINSLPDNYIKYQLEKDMNKIVAETSKGSNYHCAQKLRNKISDRMKAWRYRPQASTYCYNPVSGWHKHAVSYSSSKNERYGFFFKFRVSNKFSVGIDWTTEANFNVNVGAIKSAMERDSRLKKKTYGKNEINTMRGIVQKELSGIGRGLTLRSIAYVSKGSSAQINAWPGKQYHTTVKFR